jgi:predicted peptidase
VAVNSISTCRDQRGNDLELLKIRGIPKIAEENKNFPFIVLSPQCPSHYIWPFVFDGIMAILDELIDKHPIDHKRIFLTGLSMGGYATWDLAKEYPDMFAGIVPVCGSSSIERVERLENVPVWAFHGALDEAVPLREVEELITALTLCDGTGKLTVYPEGSHDIWTEAYQTEELYSQFFQKSLR